MRDPELVALAERAAARLGSAWERWRALQGLGETPAQPVVGYVGYALKEPWGQPRAVIGFSADEAERLADFLERSSGEYGTIDRTALERGAPSRAVLDSGVLDNGVIDRDVIGDGVLEHSVLDQTAADNGGLDLAVTSQL
jgi:hypothetical protein